MGDHGSCMATLSSNHSLTVDTNRTTITHKSEKDGREREKLVRESTESSSPTLTDHRPLYAVQPSFDNVYSF